MEMVAEHRVVEMVAEQTRDGGRTHLEQVEMVAEQSRVGGDGGRAHLQGGEDGGRTQSRWRQWQNTEQVEMMAEHTQSRWRWWQNTLRVGGDGGRTDLGQVEMVAEQTRVGGDGGRTDQSRWWRWG